MIDLYIECRIRFIEQPDIRLWTRRTPNRFSTVVHAEGVWRGAYGGYWLENGQIEVHDEIPIVEGIEAVRFCADEFYRSLAHQYDVFTYQQRRRSA